ncbi:hypothetical protein MNBD_BACTEROID07-887, partial [hydrothermal vent metagenome]
MRIYKNIQKSEWPQLCRRPKLQTGTLDKLVNEVFEKVKTSGDAALKAYTRQFDKVVLENLVVGTKEWDAGVEDVPEVLKEAILRAKKNIEIFHKAQQSEGFKVETEL